MQLTTKCAPEVALGWLPILLLSAAAHAAAPPALPPDVVGGWGTSTSLYAGNTQQAQLFLEADGAGVLVGSTAPARRMDGVDDGRPGPRALVGSPVRAMLAGDVLTVQLVAPPGQRDGKDMAGMRLVCRHAAGAPTMVCSDPNGVALALARIDAAPPAEIAELLARIRATPP